MRGQVILLSALFVATAVVAVLLLQAAAVSSPGYGGVKAAYGVFSRDISRAVEALAAYVGYMGVFSLINFTENFADYALVAYAHGDLYLRWLHVNRTNSSVYAAVAFFEINRGVLGLDVEGPGRLVYSPGSCERAGELKYADRRFNFLLFVSPEPCGVRLERVAHMVRRAEFYDSEGRRIELDYEDVDVFYMYLHRHANATYRLSLVLNVSMLAISKLNLTSRFSVSVRRLNDPSGGEIYFNVSTSKPYAWISRIEVYNRTLKRGEPPRYEKIGGDQDLVNYTEKSAVYSVVIMGRLYDGFARISVGNIPLYVALGQGSRSESGVTNVRIRNVGSFPVVCYNTTRINIASPPGGNLTRIDFEFRGFRSTYWIIHSGGYLEVSSAHRSLVVCIP